MIKWDAGVASVELVSDLTSVQLEDKETKVELHQLSQGRGHHNIYWQVSWTRLIRMNFRMKGQNIWTLQSVRKRRLHHPCRLPHTASFHFAFSLQNHSYFSMRPHATIFVRPSAMCLRVSVWKPDAIIYPSLAGKVQWRSFKRLPRAQKGDPENFWKPLRNIQKLSILF